MLFRSPTPHTLQTPPPPAGDFCRAPAITRGARAIPLRGLDAQATRTARGVRVISAARQKSPARAIPPRGREDLRVGLDALACRPVPSPADVPRPRAGGSAVCRGPARRSRAETGPTVRPALSAHQHSRWRSARTPGSHLVLPPLIAVQHYGPPGRTVTSPCAHLTRSALSESSQVQPAGSMAAATRSRRGQSARRSGGGVQLERAAGPLREIS